MLFGVQYSLKKKEKIQLFLAWDCSIYVSEKPKTLSSKSRVHPLHSDSSNRATAVISYLRKRFF
jgi:hypothetical protein